MLRRKFTGLFSIVGWLLASALLVFPAHAQFTETDAASGIRTALERGSEIAVSSLGRTDGFLGNPKVRIPLPDFLESAAKLLKFTGGSQQVDELVVAMNRAAEAAVPEARALLLNAVRSMSVDDGKRILTGGDGSVTRFFADKTREPLTERFLPIVSRQTERLALAEKYNAVAGKAAGFGLMDKREANIQHYVTAKALDGLYLMIAEEERRIRSDPVGTGSAILKQVFGGLR
ncbi:DUF4197 domain-containing protein [Piscinibacter sakaiensis]|uniref:DUF4197 domain-containing protein n=1 Tax=Piscinibacter sakaiensis TaxID=1547922 RepID=UPI003AB07E14